MLRLWLTSIGIGIVTASYEGLDPLSPYLYEWIILGGIAFFGGGLLLAAAILQNGLLVLVVLGALPLAMGYAERLLAEDIKPRAAFHRYTEDPPVGLETWVEGSYLYGRITNQHPRDWLRLAMVSCRPVYANGNPSERVLEVSIGAGGWMAPREMEQAPLVSANGLLWQPGLVIERTQCWVASADMYEAPEFTPAFTYAKNADSRYVFQVTNTRSDANLTRVSFSCWVTFDGRRSKTDLIVRPLYQGGSTYSVPPDAEIALYNDELFAGRRLDNCIARDVSWSAIR
ncbi:hypothetical protein LOK46_01995 [Methylobacterium sp. NMS14P]|uniref:hypothetical protein n=1 Tax=Methylobacterium sp. NMS14P TaxID=2894310 RepID=UPI002358DD36|nr:hypothetical protein [Methylobacterium sp. NMS14P]WCS25640.1 hypothetical protein LOK46_01995 [Methylobacterium sp. NMS14P]